jgi:hypothetical protein
MDRQLKWIGHMLVGKFFLRYVPAGKMAGKRPRGRPRTNMLIGCLKQTKRDSAL